MVLLFISCKQIYPHFHSEKSIKCKGKQRDIDFQKKCKFSFSTSKRWYFMVRKAFNSYIFKVETIWIIVCKLCQVFLLFKLKNYKKLLKWFNILCNHFLCLKLNSLWKFNIPWVYNFVKLFLKLSLKRQQRYKNKNFNWNYYHGILNENKMFRIIVAKTEM